MDPMNFHEVPDNREVVHSGTKSHPEPQSLAESVRHAPFPTGVVSMTRTIRARLLLLGLTGLATTIIALGAGLVSIHSKIGRAHV